MENLKDVQSEKDIRKVALKKVGIKDLKWPVSVMDKIQGVQNTVATLELSVKLPSDMRGTHMSRFVEMANDMKSLNPKNIELLLIQLKERLQADVAHCKIKFDYFVKKPSPVTGIMSPSNVVCTFETELSDKYNFLMTVNVPVSTLCPCSKEISEFGAHNQRATVSIAIKMDKLIWIEDIVEVAEESASSPVYSLLKREDEKLVTEQAYSNPRFVEDVVREASLKLDKLKGIVWYSVHVESMESIHNHNAFAYTENEFKFEQ
ncbi:MAG: cyclohydrolase FolE2 [Firmicutes bacterium]|nr:cyclohydrolase FolE2 [Bacillota bacterium]